MTDKHVYYLILILILLFNINIDFIISKVRKINLDVCDSDTL